jgi:hypothetical protein
MELTIQHDGEKRLYRAVCDRYNFTVTGPTEQMVQARAEAFVKRFQWADANPGQPIPFWVGHYDSNPCEECRAQTSKE